MRSKEIAVWRNASRASSLLNVASFRKKDDLEKIIQMLHLMTSELEIPTRPDFEETDLDKLACCSGEWHECWVCNRNFKRFCKLLQHKRDVHESPRFRCVCGLAFPRKGHLDRHVLKSCKGRRQKVNACSGPTLLQANKQKHKSNTVDTSLEHPHPWV